MLPSSSAASPNAPALEELVRTYEIRWRSGPERAVVNGNLRPIGLTLELTATHPDAHVTPTPGRPQCGPVIEALQRVADAVVPRDHRRSFFEVSVLPSHHVLTRSGSPEMTAMITILHQNGINEPIDACQERCLAEMSAKLEELGAPRG